MSERAVSGGLCNDSEWAWELSDALAESLATNRPIRGPFAESSRTWVNGAYIGYFDVTDVRDGTVYVVCTTRQNYTGRAFWARNQAAMKLNERFFNQLYATKE